MPGSAFRRSLAGLFAVSLLGSIAPTSHAQIANGNLWPKPRLTVLTPNGGKVGTTFEVSFTGSDLVDPEQLVFSHPGIKASPIIPPPPKPDPKADPKKPAPPPPPITRFTVTIGKEVPLGFHDVRFVNKLGVSNPRVFTVGDLNDILEKEPNNDVEQAQKVDVGTTINGTVSAPTDVDYYAFKGQKGQRLVITCLGASIDSKLHPEMRLLEPSGRQIAYHRPLPQSDGALDVTLPADGEYLLRLNQFTYTLANAEYFYRLNLSAAPYIEAVFPPTIEPGKPAQVTLYGRNLPGAKPDPTAILDGQPLDKLVVTVTPPNHPLAAQRMTFGGVVPPQAAGLDGFEYRLPSPAGPSNPVLITFARAPVVLENDNNDSMESAQEVPLPCEVAGRIEKKRDRDWYSFTCKKGDVFVIELMSHRLGAATDMYLSLRNPAAKPVAEITAQDDNADTPNNKNFYTANRDPAPFRFVAPADGKYLILVGNHLGDLVSDPTHVYRLRISQEKPDFRLIVMPAEDYRHDSTVLGQGGVETVMVFAIRQDGFKEDITLTMDNLPPGVTCTPQVLSSRMRFVHLAVTAADNASPFTGDAKVTGTATLAGQKLVREARPATVTWPTQPNQNIPTVTRLDKSLALAVRDKAPAKLVATPDKVVVSLGDKVNVNLKFQRASAENKANFQVAPIGGEFPANVQFGNLTFAPGKDEQTAVLAVATNALPGTYNLVFRGFAPIAPDPKLNKPVNTILASTPVTLTILPKQVANLTIANPNANIKAGADGVLVLQVARQFDYADSFKVELVLPKDVQGVTADPIVIPAGANEAKLTLKVPANAPPGPRQNLTIRATAVVNGNVSLVHEAKFNVTVVK